MDHFHGQNQLKNRKNMQLDDGAELNSFHPFFYTPDKRAKTCVLA